ncbi:MAG: carbohydrate-binding family 9-like protein, partial [Gemmatimonadota bacterium]|nr:carbohydrate-binding family 9-like protein [Gemmatimonadota bacterium]
AQERVVVEPPSMPHYLCYRAPSAPQVDGELSETSWQLARWTEGFVDIETGAKPAPWRTRVKMLWDDAHLFIGAELEEPHLWATLTQRDTIIYQDNDFEVFIDPDGDTHDYFEIEINALGTLWDLWLPVPYRDGGTAVADWNIDGLQSAVALDGTLNDPSDEDTGWTVELAIPWKALMGESSAAGGPVPGDHWRMNFSRVQWPLEIVDSVYRKKIDASEDNWVWSPQGAVNMHKPERWGIVQFSDRVAGRGRDSFKPDGGAVARWALWQIYYAQSTHWREHNRYATDLDDLGLATMVTPGGSMLTARMEATDDTYRAGVLETGGQVEWTIQETGRVQRVVEEPSQE